MLSCKETTRLNSERFERPLTAWERTQVWLHMRVCAACTTVFAQLTFMRQAMARYRAGTPPNRLPVPDRDADIGRVHEAKDR